MIDIVIPLGYSHQLSNQNNMIADNGDLRFCLRSIEKHLSNVGNVYIIGNRLPSWIKGIRQVIVGDKSGAEYHEWNIYNKIRVVCSIEEISNDFLFMNDDHYLLNDFNAKEFPFFYDKQIKDYLTPRDSSYQFTKRNTCEIISKESKFFDVHSPIIYNKESFAKLSRFNWTREYGYLIKSTYCAVNKIEGTQCEDLKITPVVSWDYLDKMIPGKQFFSTSDNCWDKDGALITYMNEIYNTKSKWEK